MLPTVTMNENVVSHLHDLVELVALDRQGMNDSPEADAIRDRMDRSWDAATETERRFFGFASTAIGSPGIALGSVCFADIIEEFNSLQRPPRALANPRESSMSKTARLVMNTAIVIVGLGIAIDRVAGVKNEGFQAVAHLFVGILIGGGLAAKLDHQNISTYRTQLIVAAVLIVVELACFILGTL